MTRQHSNPVLLTASGAVRLVSLDQRGSGDTVGEADIQAIIHAHPGCLPITEIDPMFADAISICTELNTLAGPIDNFMVTPSGLPVLVECKLWRNPEGRREVIGQILDYAKELSRWSSSDVQREVSRRLKISGNPLLELVRAADPTVDEVQFNDALTINLRRGRFLLLIVGDGIREGVEAIAEYLQAHGGLHFSLGLIEMPFYVMPDGSRLVAPRVLARTMIITRNVVVLPEGYGFEDARDLAATEPDIDPAQAVRSDALQRFWTEFCNTLKLDDPEQQRPNATRMGYTSLSMPAPGGSSWLTVYRDKRHDEVGVFLSSHRNTAGEYAMDAIADDWGNVKSELGDDARLTVKNGRRRVGAALLARYLEQPEQRALAFAWLGETINTFVNVLRPRVRSAVADYQARS